MPPPTAPRPTPTRLPAPPPPTLHRRAPSIAGAALAAALALAPPALAGSRAFFELAVDGAPAGRFTVELFDDVPLGAARFRDLALDRNGVGYRGTRIDGVVPGREVRGAGLPRLSYAEGGTGDGVVAGGDTADTLLPELAAAAHAHGAGAVSLVVTDSDPDPVKTRLVAINGKLVNVEEPRRPPPNGTAFVVSLARAPELDTTNLVVGRVVEGLDAVDAVSRLKASEPKVRVEQRGRPARAAQNTPTSRLSFPHRRATLHSSRSRQPRVTRERWLPKNSGGGRSAA